MSMKIFQVFLAIVLLSRPTLGQNSQQHLICKNVENVFSVPHVDSTVSHGGRILGSPGKQGPAGEKGERGLPGVQGIPGSPAIVDYDQIFENIENKTRRELQEMKSRFQELQKDFTEFVADQHCKNQNGFSYEAKCYFTPQISTSKDLNYYQAIQKCRSRNSLIAELKSRSHQNAIQEFFGSKVPSSKTISYMWLGMRYQSSERNLRLRFGEEVSVGQLKWYPGYPYGSDANIMIEIRSDDQDRYKGIYNQPASRDYHGVICEKPL